jgi:hypothetical protein
MRWAPMKKLESIITPFIVEYLSDPDLMIIDIHSIDDKFQLIVPEFAEIVPQKRSTVIINVLKRLESSLVRDGRNGGGHRGHIFYRHQERKPAIR